ncbi:MAG TPA: DUF4232 domain-containing protein [Acidimicrobiales bacterium]
MKSVKSAIIILGLVTSGFVAGGAALVPTTVAFAATAKSCVASQIKVTHGPSNGAAGTIYYPIVFTNTGAACTIFGVPAIQPVTGKVHKKVGPLARNESMGEMPAIHTLAEGQSVSGAFGVTETGNYTPSTCVARKASGVLVTLGSFVPSSYVALAITVCTKRASTTTRLITNGVTGN